MADLLRVAEIMRNDPLRWDILGMVRELRLPDCWVAAGFVRNAIWDYLHGRAPTPLAGDVDVIWFDAADTRRCVDIHYEAFLRTREQTIAWSVKNQARMHARNDDLPYVSATDAMRYFPETATAVAVRRTDQDQCDVAAPFGLDDLFSLILRPTPDFARAKHPIYAERLRTKGWIASWPLLREPGG